MNGNLDKSLDTPLHLLNIDNIMTLTTISHKPGIFLKVY